MSSSAASANDPGDEPELPLEGVQAPADEHKYILLLGLYVGFWGVLPSLAVKLVSLDLSYLGMGLLAFSYGSFIHAFTFPCTDAVAEVWGAKRARNMVYIGMMVYLLSTFALYLGTLLPPAQGWENNDAYVTLFSMGPRIFLASLISTVFAQLWDIYVFELVKKLTGERFLWVRNCSSTLVSQLFDTSIFYCVAFYAVVPNEVLVGMIFGAYLLKILVAIIDTPMVYLVVYWLVGRWTAKGDIN